jgi:PleD family two-component response regulator
MDLNNEKLLSEADKNLYEAKESGRNRYVVSEI